MEDELNRNLKYFNENVDLHVYKSQLENSLRELKEENDCCEREKFELQEQIIDYENQFEKFRDEREEFHRKIDQQNNELRNESVRKEKTMNVLRQCFIFQIRREQFEVKCHEFENQIKEVMKKILFSSLSFSFALERTNDRNFTQNDRTSRIESTSKTKKNFVENVLVFSSSGNSTKKFSFGKNDRRTSSTITKVNEEENSSIIVF